MIQDKQNRIEQVINAWDGAQKAEAPAFFYTRLKARMERNTEAKSVKSFLLKPAFVLSTLVVVIIINVFIFLQNDNSVIAVVNAEDPIQTIAAEFHMSENILEDINENK